MTTPHIIARTTEKNLGTNRRHLSTTFFEGSVALQQTVH